MELWVARLWLLCDFQVCEELVRNRGVADDGLHSYHATGDVAISRALLHTVWPLLEFHIFWELSVSL